MIFSHKRHPLYFYQTCFNAVYLDFSKTDPVILPHLLSKPSSFSVHGRLMIKVVVLLLFPISSIKTVNRLDKWLISWPSVCWRSGKVVLWQLYVTELVKICVHCVVTTFLRTHTAPQLFKKIIMNVSWKEWLKLWGTFWCDVHFHRLWAWNSTPIYAWNFKDW